MELRGSYGDGMIDHVVGRYGDVDGGSVDNCFVRGVGLGPGVFDRVVRFAKSCDSSVKHAT